MYPNSIFKHAYPYSDLHELNLDWIIKQTLEQNEHIKDFVNENTITLADPIEWSKSNHYNKAVIVEGTNGNSYLSIKEVPAGIEISNTEYWVKVANFNAQLETLKTYVTPEMYGAIGDGEHDDTSAIQAAFDSGYMVVFSDKTYLVSNTLILSHDYSYLIAAGTAEILCNTDNITIINADNITGADSTMAIIENLNIVGKGKTSGQTGINCKGWQIKLRNCNIRNCNIGLKLKGVGVYVSECYITSCYYGIKALPQKDDAPQDNIFSTMIRIDKCYLDYYEYGFYGDNSVTLPYVSLTITNTVFEKGSKALTMPASLFIKVSDCWLEANTVTSDVQWNNLIWSSNRIESGDAGVNFVGDPAYGGMCELNNTEGGAVGCKKLELHSYASGNVINRHTVEYKNAAINIDDRPLAELNYIIIKNGEVYSTNLPSNFFTFSKVSTGNYSIVLSSTISAGLFDITATNAGTVSGFETSNPASKIGCEVILTNKSAYSDYTNYDLVRDILIHTYSNADGSDQDARVIIKINKTY